MLNVLEEPAATIVAAAAFTGARKGELRGFVWENYDGEQIVISQSFWRGHTQPPKTKQSKAPVPVIAQLAGRLDQHRILLGNPGCGLMFPSPAGTPVNLDALVVDVIRPALRNAGSVVARLACIPARVGNDPPSASGAGQDDPSDSAPLQCRGDPSVLHQDGVRRCRGGDAFSRICT